MAFGCPLASRGMAAATSVLRAAKAVTVLAEWSQSRLHQYATPRRRAKCV